MNIALPHIQTGLHFSSTSLSWVMNGYTLTFGGLLLLGGRAGDILGRRRMFLAGIVIFTLASFVGGLSTSAAMLLTARAVQGVGGALASPAVLATQFLQDVLGFGPLLTGVAFLPMTLLVFGLSRLAPRLIPRVGGRRLMLAGMIPVVIGMAWLSRVSPQTSYWSGVFGPMVLLGGGMGIVFVPLTTASLAGVRREDSGAASSMVNVMQQLGGSVGLAVLVAVFGTATRNAALHPLAGLPAAAFHAHVLAHGMATAFGLAATFDAAAFVVIALLLRPGKPAVPDSAAELAEEIAATSVSD